MSHLIRINKLLSQHGVASRRKADELVAAGQVMVNGQLLTKPGALIDITKDRVSVSGQELDLRKGSAHRYYMINKPQGHLSTVEDTHQRRKVMDLIPETKGLFPVGRLDKDTTGLLLITDDGELAHRLMHPSFEIKKVYEVVLRGRIDDAALARMKKGVDIGEKRLSILRLVELKRSAGSSRLLVEIHEGKKRQIRRTFEALGYDIAALKRTEYAGLKPDIKEGSWRMLTDTEVKSLKKKVGL